MSRVATAPAPAKEPPASEVFVVNANAPRTFTGRFKKGDHLRIDVLDAQWGPQAGTTLYGAGGIPGEKCKAVADFPCIGGDAPLLGLILLVAEVPPDLSKDKSCMGVQRLYIPQGAELRLPVNAELALCANDWLDSLYDNSGSIEVLVERAASKKDPISERTTVSVSPRQLATLAGRFRAGEYVRISVVQGSWSAGGGAAPVGAAGLPNTRCDASTRPCAGLAGEPLMGLTLLMSCFSITDQMSPLQRIDRAFIPQGGELVLEHDSDIYLAPNDREDTLADNTGSARVHVRAVKP